MDAIFNRASVRAFTDEAVTEEQIEQLMRAAMAAPSAGNQQPWEFFIVSDDETKQALSQASPYAKPAARAAIVISVCSRTDGLRFASCVPQDLSAAIENILLSATELGLGGVWMGIAPDPERIAAVYEAIGKPEGVEPFAILALGHPAGEVTPKGADRYDASRVHRIL